MKGRADMMQKTPVSSPLRGKNPEQNLGQMITGAFQPGST